MRIVFTKGFVCAFMVFVGNGVVQADNWQASANATSVSGIIYPNSTNTKFAVGVKPSAAATTTYMSEIRALNSANYTWKVLKLSTSATGTGANITLSANPVGSQKYFVLNSNGGANGMIFSTGNPDANSGLGTERMRISSNGQVSIGLTSPPSSAATLVVNGVGVPSVVDFQMDGTSVARVNYDGSLVVTGEINANAGMYVQNGGVMVPNGSVSAARICVGPTTDCGDQSNYPLAVNGTIRAKEVIVETGWPDFVFGKDYPLMSLDKVENFISRNGHLPEIPSEKEVQKKGIGLGAMNAKLLQKVEELTLYIIEQEKRIQKLERSAVKR